MKADNIKPGRRYRIRFDGRHNREFVEKYSGTGLCLGYEGFQIFTFSRLKPRIKGYSLVCFAAQDIVGQVKTVACKTRKCKL